MADIFFIQFQLTQFNFIHIYYKSLENIDLG